jgi:hypothetical protein
LADLKSTRERMRIEMKAALTDVQKRFLLGLVAGTPDWRLVACRHLSALPAIQWKLQNLARLKKTNSLKFRQQTDDLEKYFSG